MRNALFFVIVAGMLCSVSQADLIMSNGFDDGDTFAENGWTIVDPNNSEWTFSSGAYGNPLHYAWGGAFTAEREDIITGRLSYDTGYAIQEDDYFRVDFDATAMEATPEPNVPFGSSLLAELRYRTDPNDAGTEVVLDSLEIMRADMAFGWGAPEYYFYAESTSASVGKNLIITFSGGPNSWNGESAQRIGIDNVAINTGLLPECGDDEHPYPVGDLDLNCSVDILDVAIFASNWLACTHPDGCL